VQATSSARRQIRAEQKRRMFPTIEYVDRVSHFDPASDYHDFRGFFVLFWIGLAIMVLTSMLRQVKETGYPFQITQWDLFKEKLWEVGLVDGAMVGSTAVALPLQKLFLHGTGPLRWGRLGMAIQSIYQVFWLSFWCTYPFIRDWSWTAQVFFTLHLLAIFMKMHSYAFYNGHLSETLRRLNELDHPSTGTSKAAAVRYPHSRTHLHELPQSPSKSEPDAANQESLRQLREDLAFELSSPLGRVSYPENLNLSNWVDYIFCPTLCYELEYPRVAYIRPLEVFYKALAVFGCIFLMVITTEEFILPVLDESAEALHHAKNGVDFSLILAETIGRLLFPFMITFLLTFLVIFEYILGAFAEITRESLHPSRKNPPSPHPPLPIH
jgi:sterol O-acyltransferase